MEIEQAQKNMGKNFLGPDQLQKIANKLNIANPVSFGEIPKLQFSAADLKRLAPDYLLILGMPKNKQGRPLTINQMRSFYGADPGKREPCFYHQDWYLKENFSNQTTLKFGWYLISKTVDGKTRGREPEVILKKLAKNQDFPSAILTAFTFFAYYFLTGGKILWKHDFIWCADRDSNGDRVYTGRYIDPKGKNKNGFNIHRHLSIRRCYGCVTQLKV